MAGKANTLFLTTNIGGTVTTYYLNSTNAAGTTAYAGAGTPWTAPATTPFELAMNDRTGQRYTPQAAPESTIFSGGPPFVNGSGLVYSAYDNIEETIPLQIRANNADNLIYLKQLLQSALKSGRFGAPVVLGYLPYGTTNTIYFNVFDGEVQEKPDAANEETNRGIFRLNVKIVRSFAGGQLSSGETAISSATAIKNAATGTPNNVVAFASGLSGEMQNEGQPLNVKLTLPPAGGTNYYVTTIYAASVHSRVAATASQSGTTFGGEGLQVASLPDIDVSLLLTRRVKPRILIQVSGSSNCEVQLRVESKYLTDSFFSSPPSFYRSPWMKVNNASGAVLLDTGTWASEFIRATRGMGTQKLRVSLYGRTTDGAIYTCTVTDAQYLFYYTFAKISGAFQATSLVFDTFAEQANMACLPFGDERVISINSSNEWERQVESRGVLPRYYPGASLWIAMLESGYYNTARTATVEATHAPLWRTLRGK